MDYSQGKIYRIVNSDLQQYYGSTTQPLEKRFYQHKMGYLAWLKDNTKKYCSSYEVFKGNNIEIQYICECPCSSKKELRELEQIYIENDDCVNKQNAYASLRILREQQKKYRQVHSNKIKKYREDKKEQIKSYRKQYNIENAEKIKEQRKQYRLQNKDKIKEYAQNNADKIRLYKKRYNEINKDKIKEQKNLYYKNYMNNKYNSDPDYREKVKERRRERYQRKKLETTAVV